MLDIKTIKKYQKQTAHELRDIAVKYFNKFIRLRDCDQYGFGRCISSGRPTRWGREFHAGHYIPAGKCEALRFNEDNVHGQSMSDNYFAHGDLSSYRINLVKKIGEDRVKRIEEIYQESKRHTAKLNRFVLIETIETYKAKCKELAKTKMFKP